MAVTVNLNRNAAQFMILAAGPIVHESGMMPCRVVLRRNASGYVTHKQGLRGTGDRIHQSFSGGNYFMSCDGGQGKAMEKAVADYCKRLTEQVAGKSDDQLFTL